MTESPLVTSFQTSLNVHYCSVSVNSGPVACKSVPVGPTAFLDFFYSDSLEAVPRLLVRFVTLALFFWYYHHFIVFFYHLFRHSFPDSWLFLATVGCFSATGFDFDAILGPLCGFSRLSWPFFEVLGDVSCLAETLGDSPPLSSVFFFKVGFVFLDRYQNAAALGHRRFISDSLAFTQMAGDSSACFREFPWHSTGILVNVFGSDSSCSRICNIGARVFAIHWISGEGGGA